MSLRNNMFSFAFQLTSNRDDAEDLLQDTTLKALDSEDKYLENTNFKGWVFTIMRNLFINRYRHLTRAAGVIDREENLYKIEIVSDDVYDTPEGVLGAGEITRAIENLPAAYRVPFSMHIAGYKYAEIAERMKLPLGTIKSRIFFTRQRLQQRFADYR